MNTVSLSGVTSIDVFGDSYSVGAPYANYALPGFIYDFAGRKGISTIRNAAQGGTQAFVALQAAHQALPLNRAGLVVWQGSFHDVRRGGLGVMTFAKLEGLIRAFIANAFLGSAQPASTGANVGMVQAWPASTLKDVIGAKSPALGGTAMAGGKGCSLTFTVTGKTIVVGHIVADGVTQHVGPFNVTIDGVLMPTVFPDCRSDALGYYPNGYDQARIPGVEIFNVTDGAHTVIIEPLESQENGPWSIPDYVGSLVDPAQGAPLIIMLPPRMTATGYAEQSPQYSNASDDAITAHAILVRKVASEFSKFPIAIVDTNAFFSLDTDVYTDNQHPNYSGHTHLADALCAVCV